jgi:hypothetical protein
MILFTCSTGALENQSSLRTVLSLWAGQVTAVAVVYGGPVFRFRVAVVDHKPPGEFAEQMSGIRESRLSL